MLCCVVRAYDAVHPGYYIPELLAAVLKLRRILGRSYAQPAAGCFKPVHELTHAWECPWRILVLFDVLAPEQYAPRYVLVPYSQHFKPRIAWCSKSGSHLGLCGRIAGEHGYSIPQRLLYRFAGIYEGAVHVKYNVSVFHFFKAKALRLFFLFEFFQHTPLAARNYTNYVFPVAYTYHGKQGCCEEFIFPRAPYERDQEICRGA